MPKTSSTLAGKPWRKFEKVITGLEEFLGPKGATVKSPDVLLDKDTGSPIKVDGTIRYFDGIKPVLIVLECRDRGRSQEVMWIRELATRKIDTQADFLIGVSSSGFTPEAVRKAKAHGVDLRKLDNKLAGKLIDSYIFRQIGRLNVKKYEVSLYVDDNFPDPEQYFRENVMPQFAADNKIIHSGGNLFSVHSLTDYYFSTHPTMKQDLEVGFEHESRLMHISLGYHYGSMFFETEKGNLQIRGLEIDFVMLNEAVFRLDRESYQRYHDMEGNDLAERLTYSRILDNGEKEIYEWKRRPGSNDGTFTKIDNDK